MAHVLVFHDDLAIACLLTEVIEMEGHAVITVHTADDALMVLRTSLHPLVGVVERDRSSRHPGGAFFEIVRDHPDRYGQHRYIALHSWELSEDETTLMRSLNVSWLALPFSVDEVLALVNEAVASLN